MINYTPSNQLTLSGFSHPFDQVLSPENRWVKLAKIIPWGALASVYLKQLSSTSGRESIDVRMVIAAIVIKHKLYQLHFLKSLYFRILRYGNSKKIFYKRESF